MTPMQQYSAEVKKISLDMIKATMPEAYKIMIELVLFENNPMQMVSERLTMLPQTYEAVYMEKNSLVKAKRKDASGIVYISKWDEVRQDWISIKHCYIKTLAKPA